MRAKRYGLQSVSYIHCWHGRIFDSVVFFWTSIKSIRHSLVQVRIPKECTINMLVRVYPSGFYSTSTACRKGWRHGMSSQFPRVSSSRIHEESFSQSSYLRGTFQLSHILVVKSLTANEPWLKGLTLFQNRRSQPTTGGDKGQKDTIQDIPNNWIPGVRSYTIDELRLRVPTTGITPYGPPLYVLQIYTVL